MKRNDGTVRVEKLEFPVGIYHQSKASGTLVSFSKFFLLYSFVHRSYDSTSVMVGLELNNGTRVRNSYRKENIIARIFPAYK